MRWSATSWNCSSSTSTSQPASTPSITLTCAHWLTTTTSVSLWSPWATSGPRNWRWVCGGYICVGFIVPPFGGGVGNRFCVVSLPICQWSRSCKHLFLRHCLKGISVHLAQTTTWTWGWPDLNCSNIQTWKYIVHHRPTGFERHVILDLNCSLTHRWRNVFFCLFRFSLSLCLPYVVV